MAIKKVNIDGEEYELAGSGGGGSSNELVYELDITQAMGSNFDYLLTETWFAENINDDNIKNLKIKVIINADGTYVYLNTLLGILMINANRAVYINIPDVGVSLGTGFYILFNELYQIQEVNNI